MKKGLILFALCLITLMTDSGTNELILKSGVGSSDFGIAFLGLTAALLMRDSGKK